MNEFLRFYWKPLFLFSFAILVGVLGLVTSQGSSYANLGQYFTILLIVGIAGVLGIIIFDRSRYG